MTWSGHPEFRTYERQARRARAHLLTTSRRALARRIAEAVPHLQRRFARPWPSV